MRYEDLGIYAVLAPLAENPNALLFSRKMLNLLKVHDQQHGSCLLETLRTYYDCNCNARHTSEVTFSHYNTVLYRLARIREVLGKDIDDADTKLELQIALKLDHFS